jgi:hypothetical protein
MILLIPTAMLLAVSFFILVTVSSSKVETKSLKMFGWVICIFMWVVAALLLATAITSLTPRGCCGSDNMMMGSCPLMGAKNRGMNMDPHHPWMNNPRAGMMMNTMDDMSMESGSDKTTDTMSSMMGRGKGKCPGMGDMGDMKDMPEKK